MKLEKIRREKNRLIVCKSLDPREFLELQAGRWNNYGWNGDQKPAHDFLSFSSEEVWKKTCGFTGDDYLGVPVDVAAPIYKSKEYIHSIFHLNDSSYWKEEKHRVPKFIWGKSGTGKNQIAAILARLAGLKHIFVKNLAAETIDRIEANFLGTVTGAYTGATYRKGYLERAASNPPYGAMFLDQIESTTTQHQVMFLDWVNPSGRPIMIERMGSGLDKPAKKKIASAFDPHKKILQIWFLIGTNQNPYDLVSRGQLRPDFFYRCGEILHLPTVDDRIRMAKKNNQSDYLERLIFFMTEQIHPVIEAELRNDYKTLPHCKPWGSSAINMIEKIGLPGNFRQLANIIQGFHPLFFDTDANKTDIKRLEATMLDAKRASTQLQPEAETGLLKHPYKMTFKDLVRIVFEEEKGDVAEIARRLNVDRRTVKKNLFSDKNTWRKWIDQHEKRKQ